MMRKERKTKCSIIKCTPRNASSVGSSLKLSASEHLPVERIAEMNTAEEKIGKKEV